MQVELTVLRHLKQWSIIWVLIVLGLTACNRTLEIGIMDTQTPIADTPATRTLTTAPATSVASTTTPTSPPASPTQAATSTAHATHPATSTPAPPTPTTVPANATPEGYERRDTAVGMLASYYNAINREEYRRAYGYRESPQESFEEFAGGFDDTATVLPIVQVPPYPGAAAGNRYAAIPTLLLASQVDGNQQTFAGCFVAHRAAPEVAGHPTDWSLQSAQVDAQSNDTAGVSLLAGACESYERSTAAIVYDERSTPISLLASYYNAIERKEYRRAYDYWKQPAQSFQEFAQGFADTNTIQVYAALPGNAGGRVSIPVLLQATEEDDSRHLYLGCFAMERTISQPHTWSLYDATVAPTNTDNAMQIRQACM